VILDIVEPSKAARCKPRQRLRRYESLQFSKYFFPWHVLPTLVMPLRLLPLSPPHTPCGDNHFQAYSKNAYLQDADSSRSERSGSLIWNCSSVLCVCVCVCRGCECVRERERGGGEEEEESFDTIDTITIIILRSIGFSWHI